jgi:hypothetical protein
MVFYFLYTLFLKVRGGKFAIKQLWNSGKFWFRKDMGLILSLYAT